MGQIDRVAAEAALGQRDGDFGGKTGAARARGVDHHTREARRQGEPRDRPALLGDAPVVVERAERGQQRARLMKRRARRGVEELQARGIGDAPQREIEREPRRSAERISGGA